MAGVRLIKLLAYRLLIRLAGGADLLDIVCSAECPLATVSANAHFTAARLLSSQSRSMYYCHAVKELVSFAISPPGYLI